MTAEGCRCVIAMFNAARISSVRKCVCIDQPTTRREYTSSTIARYKNPDHVGMYVISATHNRSGPSV
jgi:hypothetical protein